MRLHQLRWFISVSLIVLIIAGYSSTLMIPQVSAFWTLTVNPSSRTAEPGGSTQYTVKVSGSLPAQKVALLVSPPEPGLTVTFSPNKGNVPFTSTMTVHISPSKPLGTYTLNVWANPEGDPFPGPTNQQITVKLDVVTPVPMPTAPFFDFNIEISPPLIEVGQGDPAHYQIHISYSDPAFSGTPINIQVTGLGPDINWHSTPSGDLTITTSPTTPPGDYPVEVTGTAQGIVHHATATLIVGEHPPEEPPFEEPPPEEPPPEELPPEEPPPEEPPEELPEEHVPTAPSLMLSTGIIDEGAITVTGFVSPPLIGEETATVDVTYTGPKGEKITHTVPVRGYDTFEDTYQPTAKGTWTIVADWQGTDMFLPASSQPATVTIEPEGFPFFMDPLIWIIVALAIVVIALVVALARRGKTTAVQRPQAKAGYCANCGAQLKPGKVFCTSCGEKAE